MFKSFLKNNFWFLFCKKYCFTLFPLFWTFLTWGKNPFNWSYRNLIFVSSCIHDILGWNFPCLIMDRQRRFKIGIKSKKKKKVSALKNTLYLHFWFQVNFFMQTKPYIYRFFLENLNIIHMLVVAQSYRAYNINVPRGGTQNEYKYEY